MGSAAPLVADTGGSQFFSMTSEATVNSVARDLSRDLSHVSRSQSTLALRLHATWALRAGVAGRSREVSPPPGTALCVSRLTFSPSDGDERVFRRCHVYFTDYWWDGAFFHRVLTHGFFSSKIASLVHFPHWMACLFHISYCSRILGGLHASPCWLLCRGSPRPRIGSVIPWGSLPTTDLGGLTAQIHFSQRTQSGSSQGQRGRG